MQLPAKQLTQVQFLSYSLIKKSRWKDQLNLLKFRKDKVKFCEVVRHSGGKFPTRPITTSLFLNLERSKYYVCQLLES